MILNWHKISQLLIEQINTNPHHLQQKQLYFSTKIQLIKHHLKQKPCSTLTSINTNGVDINLDHKRAT